MPQSVWKLQSHSSSFKFPSLKTYNILSKWELYCSYKSWMISTLSILVVHLLLSSSWYLSFPGMNSLALLALLHQALFTVIDYAFSTLSVYTSPPLPSTGTDYLPPTSSGPSCPVASLAIYLTLWPACLAFCTPFNCCTASRLASCWACKDITL